MGDLAYVLVIILVVFGGRILAGSLDYDRIRQYIRKGGGKVIDINRQPFGPGWFGSHERIYEAKYETRDGKLHTATCKTSLFAGIYWTGGAPGLIGGKETSVPMVSQVEPATTPEPMPCLSCGTQIPAKQTHCPKCGWSYPSA